MVVEPQMIISSNDNNLNQNNKINHANNAGENAKNKNETKFLKIQNPNNTKSPKNA